LIRFFSTILFLILFVQAYSKDLKIGLFEKSPISKLTIKYNIGRYSTFTENKIYPIFSDKKGEVKLEATKNKVTLFINGINKGESIWFRMDKLSDLNSLTIMSYASDLRYRGNIIVYAVNGKLQVINEIDLDQYVEGVIKGEAGYGYHEEYYKVQAIMSRTYSLSLHKHKEQGFDLCDHTHCQVYKGINYEGKITRAVSVTKGLVIVDSNLNYLNALFHSNCGGQTVTTDYVWSKRLDCMESVLDPFCRNSSQANWKKTISKDKWVRFVSNKINSSEDFVNSNDLNFNQAYRKKNYKIGYKEIKLVEIRNYYRLKSTFFSVHDIGDKIVLIGRGFGHGVGLCQEGAIVMTQKGYTFNEALHYYYYNVSIIDINKLNFYLLF
jgi:stage II sporulation protein D